ncbi:conjugal transfer protein TraB (plasmid) [Enterobacter asburiae]|nr:conjugal transfer protein TraB [Enterobacter asburiae]
MTISLNENLKTRRKQLAILAAVIIGGATAAGGVMWYGQYQQKQKQPAPVATPNLTGVVTATFNEQVNDAALAQQQAKTSALEQSLATLTQQFAQNKLNTEQKLAEKDAEIQRLSDQLTKAPGSNQTTGQQTPPAGQNGTPLPGPVAAGQARPPEYNVTPTGAPAATGVNMGQGTAFYPGGSGQRMTGGLSTTKFSYDSLKKKPTKLPWIPSGSFSDAVLIEGADANASVTGQQNTSPVTIRLQGNIQMPNNKEFNADGCFIVGEMWGDISSERGNVRTQSISCILKNGKHVDMEFQGHVSFQGKGGIRGKPVMRNGMIVGYAGAAGLLSGFGEGIKSAATPSVGLGATADVGAGDVFKQGIGGGASKAADTLSQYWIKRAEQYHPVIDIGAGNQVTVVFQKGFRLETIEDAEEAKAKEELQKAGNAAQNAVTPQPASQTTASSTTSVGNINPDDVLRQASQLRLGDTIN